MPIFNEIFEAARKERQMIEQAIKLLQDNGYVVSSKEKTYASSK
ncbi:MAG TPA: hypothetical protein VLB82_06015 [Thermodesulfobacteriota bacterium]|jgi:biotin operon repressor|nr:hypothetical protein [Thermodesulfobacteriota bacterium]